MDKRAEYVEELSLAGLLNDFKGFADTKVEGQLFNKIRMSESEIQSALITNVNQKREELQCMFNRYRSDQQSHPKRGQASY